ncbi:MAG: sulfatase-like hydrolase/transferase [Hoeflea sp.]|uniref:sulfatase-like hydrolase/transferase n=1 Tax=Hoeflea sp. TaxID=1940281 RepID=UPI003299401D
MALLQKILNFAFNPIAAIVATLLGTAFLYLLEKQAGNMPFVLLCNAGIAAMLFLASRRLYFSIYATLAFATLISIASTLKYRTKGFDLHIYDIIFTGADPKAAAFLLDAFTIYVVPFAGLLLLGIAAVTLIFVRERTSAIAAPWRVGFLALTIALIPMSYPLRADEPRYFHYLGGFNASSFFVSFLDLRDAALGRGIADRFASMPAGEPFDATQTCDSAATKPDLFVVLSESQTDLSRLDQYGLDQQFSDRFKSADGTRHSLQVETFGGGTWISNFSLMTGLSSLDFGWRAPYLTTAMEGKIHQSLATELARCGYRTAVLMPMEHGFVNEGPFLESIGFDDILDYDRIGASEYAHEDRFYFEAARDFISEHRKTDGRPLFLQVQTMFAHSPYSDNRTEAGTPMTGKSGIGELDEYVGRVAQSQRDFDWFLDQAKAESKTHPSIVLEFGDHQSFATRELIENLNPDFAIDDLSSSAYRTYFTLHGNGTPVDMSPFDFPVLDIGYLGASLLEAAGLAKSPMLTDLLALKTRCNGRLHSCQDRAAVDRHLQRRIASGYLDIN